YLRVANQHGIGVGPAHVYSGNQLQRSRPRRWSKIRTVLSFRGDREGHCPPAHARRASTLLVSASLRWISRSWRTIVDATSFSTTGLGRVLIGWPVASACEYTSEIFSSSST